MNAQIVSDFTSNDEGWTCFDYSSGSSSAVSYSATGGNSGGNVSYTTGSAGVQFYWFAPAKFLGNFSASYNKTISFDLQLSQSGTDNSQGDVVITNSAAGISLFYSLTKPLTATWTKYNVTLNETSGWKKGSIFGPAPTKDELKSVLVNLTQLRIRIKYSTAGAGPYTGQLDNVTLNTASFGTPPVISSFSPTKGVPSTTVTIDGSGFNSTPSQNAVYFGAVKANVLNATATQLQVSSPDGAPQAPITVINLGTNLQGKSTLIFNSLFDNNQDYGGRIIPASMSIGYKTSLQLSNGGNSFGGMATGDFDNDGWVDLVMTETSTKSVFAYRNIGVSTPVTTSSFQAPITLPGTIDGEVTVGDFDNDGLLDVAGLFSGASYEYFKIFRNTSTSGNISFAAPLQFALPNYAAYTMHAADLDGDGRVDLMATNGSSGSQIWISQNLSSPGNIDFAACVVYGGVSAYSHMATADLNNDGKAELVATYYSQNLILIFPNNSTPGVISLGPSFTLAPTSATIADTRLSLADLDQDSKPDLMWCGYGSTNLYVKKNLYTGGVLDATAFGADIVIPSTLSHPTGVSTGDMNGDGKTDIVAVGFSDMAIFQNKTSPGALDNTSFENGVLFEGASGGDAIYATGPYLNDLDGDHKPEVIMGYTNSYVNAYSKCVFIYRNECYPAPSITSITPGTQQVSGTVTISGSALNTYNDTPIIRIQGISLTPSSLTNTSADVAIANGAVGNRIEVTLHGLSAYKSPFAATFTTVGNFNSSTFAGSSDYPLSTSSASDVITIADYDNDGRPDVVVDDNAVGKIYRNVNASPGDAITTGTLTLLTGTLAYGYRAHAGDFDGDGLTDVAVNGSVFQNNSGTQSEPISFTSSVYTTVSNVARMLSGHDFNHDGKLELVATTTGNQIIVAENQTRKGAFTYATNFASFPTSPLYITPGGQMTEVTSADYDGDGFDDIAFGLTLGVGASNVSLLLNTGAQGKITSAQFAPTTTLTTGLNPRYISSADFDGDGKVDIAVGNNGSTFVSVYRNTSTVGTLSFVRQDITCLSGTNGLQTADLDGDGKPEIIIVNQISSAGSFSVFKNTSSPGNISFATSVDYALPGTPYTIGVADMNLDSKPDLLITQYGLPKGFLSIFENKLSTPLTISIDSQPGDVSVCSGTTAKLSVSASGATNLIYQWQMFDSNLASYVDLSDNATYTGVTSSALNIKSNSPSAAGSYRCRIDGDLAYTAYSNDAELTISVLPTAPMTTGNSACSPDSVTLSASGGIDGQYRWYTKSIGGTAIAGEVNDQYVTPLLSTTTKYFVSVNDGTCESSRTAVIATMNTPPNSPSTTDTLICTSAAITLHATGGTNGGYRWYTTSTGVAIAGETNDKYSTPTISGNETYYVALNDGTCEGPKSAINIVLGTTPAAPSIADTTLCSATSVTLKASGGSSGEYRWYLTSSDVNSIAGETNSTLTTPSINSNTTYYVALNNGSCESTRSQANIFIGTVPNAPSITSDSICQPQSVTLAAAGGNDGDYRWYDATGAINGETSAVFNTPLVINNTSFFVSLNNGICESVKTTVNVVIDSVTLTQPLIASSIQPINGIITICDTTAVSLSAPAGFNYTWSNGSLTRQIDVTSSAHIAVKLKDASGCVSPPSDTIQVVIQTCNAIIDNPPTISQGSLETQIQGNGTINLAELISDPDDNADLATLKIVKQPPSGAQVYIDENLNLVIDYKGVSFSGMETVTIEVCDTEGKCTQQEITIEVSGELIVYNGFSPNGDTKNAVFFIQNIDVLDDTRDNHVTIYNRWGDVVFETTNYDNANHVFTGNNNNGKELPAGNYFYKIDFTSGRKSISGYLSLKR